MRSSITPVAVQVNDPDQFSAHDLVQLVFAKNQGGFFIDRVKMDHDGLIFINGFLCFSGGLYPGCRWTDRFVYRWQREFFSQVRIYQHQ